MSRRKFLKKILRMTSKLKTEKFVINIPNFLSVHLSCCSSFCLSNPVSFPYLPICLFVHITALPSNNLSVCVVNYFSICFSVCLLNCPSFHLSVCSSTRPSIHLSVCLCIQISFPLSLFLYVQMSVLSSVCLPNFCPSFHPSVCL